MSNLSEQLTELMNEDGYTQSTLAEAMKTPRAKISLYLSGKSVPNYKYLVAFINFFNCSADFLIGLKDYPNRDVPYKPVQPFNIRLREILKQKGKTQKSLIEVKHFSWNTLHGWLTGKSLPSVDNLKKLAKFFDCSVDFILGRTDY
ncbi:MAG: helix-turn-helix domain-containing protein [Clostridia bacterium]|nr:helix-turn-helix domain-containing protein [Clostridia bacterium]